MTKHMLSMFALIAIVFTVVACETAPKSTSERAELEAAVKQTVRDFREADPSMDTKFENAAGYAVFPSVGKGGVGVGGAYGKGMLVVDGNSVGYCDLSQGSIGFQLGGQVYSEIIFFESDTPMEKFKSGTFEFAAQASAVAATAGASADAPYENGTAVFTMAGKGLMFEASIGGQNFTYEPK